MDHMRFVAVLALAAALLLRAVPGVAQNSDPGRHADGSGGWHFELVPYLWASGVEGRVGIRGRTADVDVGFRDLIKHLSGALTLAAGARHDRWAIGSEVIWIWLSDQRATPGPLFSGAGLTASQLILELTGRYRLVDAPLGSVEAFVGGRYWHLRNTLSFESGALPGREFRLNESWFDPILGVSAVANLSQRWLVQARGDFGGFEVGSERTWQALGLLGYHLSGRVDVMGGYRYLSVDFSDDDKGFLYDIDTRGPILGVVVRL